ncbi:MAG: helix-turn-helix transcriptional regulator [Promethearchaeota archaeon]
MSFDRKNRKKRKLGGYPKMSGKKITEAWESDVRRGLLELVVLSIIKEGNATFGYAISQAIRERTADKLILRDGTLYPLLRRLVEQKLVSDRWDVSGDRPRKYYTITSKGEERLKAMLIFWNDLMDTLNPLFQKIVVDLMNNNEKEKDLYCSRCGFHISPGASFCASCGIKIREAEMDEHE